MAQLPKTPLSRRSLLLGLTGSAAALAGCAPNVETGRPLGSRLNEGQFGVPTRTNIGLHNGNLSYEEVLNQRFASFVQTTVNFAFNSTALDAEARAILNQQAAFIRHFPEVRFSVFGHADAVGSQASNQRLGRRRANAVVDYLTTQGVHRSRLRALVSLGETQPVVPTEAMERLNRRAVTQVSGFMETHPLVLDGRYAEIVYRTYRSGPSGGGGGDGGG